jgi:hypothetical protein
VIGDVRRLCRFKRPQDVPRHVCRPRLAVTVKLKFIDELTLPRNVTFAFNNVAFVTVRRGTDRWTGIGDAPSFATTLKEFKYY